jgi:hypothetical protein
MYHDSSSPALTTRGDGKTGERYGARVWRTFAAVREVSPGDWSDRQFSMS